MYILHERFSHLASSNIGDRVKRQAIVDFVIRIEVFSDGVDYKTEEVRVLVHEQGDSQVALWSEM